MKSLFKFLSVHDDPPAPAQPQPPAPQTMVPAAVVIDMADALAARAEARARLAAAQHPQPPVATTPAPAPVPQQQPDDSPDKKDIRDLKNAVNHLTNALNMQQLQTYRATAIAQALGAGKKLVEALVFGSTPQEIDASIGVACAEYAVLEAQWQKDHPTPAPVTQPAPQTQVPQGTVTSTAPGTPPAQQPQQQPQALSLPGFVSAPGVPDGQPMQITAEQLAYITSPAGIRDGSYAKYRNLVHAGLQNSAGRPPTQWGFSTAPSLVPPMQAPTSQGLSVPQVVPQQGRTAAGPPPNPGSMGAPPQRGAPPQFTPPGSNADSTLAPLAGFIPHADAEGARAAALASVGGRVGATARDQGLHQ